MAPRTTLTAAEVEPTAYLVTRLGKYLEALAENGCIKTDELDFLAQKVHALDTRLPPEAAGEDILLQVCATALRTQQKLIKVLVTVLVLTFGGFSPKAQVEEYLNPRWDTYRLIPRLHQFLVYGLEDLGIRNHWEEVKAILTSTPPEELKTLLEKYTHKTVHKAYVHCGASEDLESTLEYFDEVHKFDANEVGESVDKIANRAATCLAYNRRKVLESPRELGAKVRVPPSAASTDEHRASLVRLGLDKNTSRYIHFDMDTCEWNCDVVKASLTNWAGTHSEDARGLAVMVVGSYDYNDYLDRASERINPLLKAYRVITLETEAPEEARLVVEEIVRRHGKIDLLGFLAHGNAYRINLGKNLENKPRNNWFLSLEPMLNVGAHLVIASCDADQVTFRNGSGTLRKLSNPFPKPRAGLEPLREKRPDLRIHTSGGITNDQLTWNFGADGLVESVSFSLLDTIAKPQTVPYRRKARSQKAG